MNAHTRHFVLAGSGILVLGLLVGGVAFLTGGGPTALVAQAAPDELRYVPMDATFVAYANVSDVMHSGFRARLRDVRPDGDDEQQRFFETTGIDLEQDIDHVVVSALSPPEGLDDLQEAAPVTLALLVGRFDAARLEALARDHGAEVEEHAGHTMLTGVPTDDDELVSMSFVESDVLALGASALVRQAIDVARGTAPPDVTENERLMRLMSHVRGDHNTWAVADFSGFDAASLLPEGMGANIPPLAAIAVGGLVNDGVSTSVTVETRDDQAAQDLREVVQGFVALARMQMGSYPNLRPVLDSIQLRGEDVTLTLTMELSSEILDLLFSGQQAAEL